jgi:hypothetical protein
MKGCQWVFKYSAISTIHGNLPVTFTQMPGCPLECSTNNCPFMYTKTKIEYQKQVGEAVNLQLMMGEEGVTFNPVNRVCCREMCAFTTAALGLSGGN